MQYDTTQQCKEQTTDMCKHMDESPMCSTKPKKPDLMADTA